MEKVLQLVFNADGNALAEVVEARVRTTEVNVLK